MKKQMHLIFMIILLVFYIQIPVVWAEDVPTTLLDRPDGPLQEDLYWADGQRVQLDGKTCTLVTGNSAAETALFTQYTLSSFDAPVTITMSFFPTDTVNQMYFATSGHAKISNAVVLSDLDQNRWHTLTLILYPDTQQNDLYVDGIFYGSTIAPVQNNILRVLVIANGGHNTESISINLDDYSIYAGEKIPVPDFPMLLSGQYDGLQTVTKYRCDISDATVSGEKCSFITGVRDTSADNDFFLEYTLPQSNFTDFVTMSISFLPSDTVGDIRFGTRFHIGLSPVIPMATLDPEKWHTLTLIADLSSGSNRVYLDGSLYATTNQNISDGVLRVIVNAATDLNDVQMYMDNYMVCAGAVEFPVTTGSPTLSGDTLYGCHGMTVSEVIASLTMPNENYSAVITNKGVVVTDETIVTEEMRLTVWKNDVFIAQYYLKESSYEFENTTFFSNGYGDTKFNLGTCSIEFDAINSVEPSTIEVTLAQYNLDGSVLSQDTREYLVAETTHIKNSILVKELENTYIQYSVTDKSTGLTLLESEKILPYSNTEIEHVAPLYPGFTTKAVTFSYDDGVTEDMQLIKLFDQYGAKGTFNLVGSRLENNYGSVAQSMNMDVYSAVKEIYQNHEVQNHTYAHKPSYLMEGQTASDSHGNTLYGCSLGDAIADVTDNAAFLKEKLGVTPRGIAWPNGYPQVRTDYEQLEQAVLADGHVYARYKESGNFHLPDNWMEWSPTCHHNNAPMFAKQFTALPNSGDLKLFYIWGHAYEFSNAGDDGSKNWAMMESVLSQLRENNVWFASNGEIYDYIHALDDIKQSGTEVKNNSDQTVYYHINGLAVSIEPGETYQAGQAGDVLPPKIEIDDSNRGNIIAHTDIVYGSLIMAAYNNRGELINITASNDTQAEISTAGAETIKIFLLESMDSLKPLRDAVVIDGINDTLPSIACWGDSLTYGQGSSNPVANSYPSVLAQLSGTTVYNMGVPGETATTIATRQGSLKILLSEAVTIPENGSVEIYFKASNGGVVTPRDVSSGGWNPCSINGVIGRLDVTVDTSVWPRVLKNATFTRSQPGEEITAAAGTELIPHAHSVIADINVIFSGTNGGWSEKNFTLDQSYNNAEEITAMIAMLKQQAQLSYQPNQYVIIGLTTQDNAYWAQYETACVAAFGDKFFNLRQALADETLLRKNGITPTSEDLAHIQRGAVPPSLLAADQTHFNDTGYRLIGTLLYEKLKTLGYLT